MKITKKKWEGAIDYFNERGIDGRDGTYWFVMEDLDDGRELCLVFGYDEGYEKDDEYYQIAFSDEEIWTLCAKLAVNIDSLQCDYNVDWFEPWDKKTKQIWDTNRAIVKNRTDYQYFNDQAPLIAKALNKGVLEVE